MQKTLQEGEDQDKSLTILVAEDEAMVRLRLEEILSKYNVIFTENGKDAKEKLQSPQVQESVDLFLIDVNMPEMNGIELLQYIKSDPKLSSKPCIMLSADNDNTQIARCRDIGAVDYFVKPLYQKDSEKLKDYVKPGFIKPKIESDYNYIKQLYRNEFAEIWQVQRKADYKVFAMKKIKTYQLTKEQKQQSKEECKLLEFLRFQFIIGYENSFENFDEQTFCIVMEFGHGGSLDKVIEEAKKENKPIPTEKIQDWITHMIMALYVVHSRNIIHRDIKPHNILLSDNQTMAKMGDFGVSKSGVSNEDYTKTFTGTPYYLAPEILKKERYGQKADIWALGCTIYELLTLSPPFTANQIDELFEKIKSDDFVELPSTVQVDKDLKDLVDLMLQKDPEQRPTIKDIVRMEWVRKNIERVSKKHNIKKFLEEQQSTEVYTAPVHKQKQQQSLNRWIQESIQKLYTKIPKTNVKTGVFGKRIQDCIRKDDLKGFLESEIKDIDPKGVEQVIQYLMDERILLSSNNQHIFSLETSERYLKLKYDNYRGASNLTKLQFEKPKMTALEKSVQILQVANDILVNGKKIKKPEFYVTLQLDEYLQYGSSRFQKFEEEICQLQMVDINALNPNQKSCFFMNLYQIMHFHSVVLETDRRNQEKLRARPTIRERLISLFSWSQSSKPIEISYLIQDTIFKYHEVILILRENKRFGNNNYTIPKDSPLVKYTKKYDPRIQILLRAEDKFPSQLYKIFKNENNWEEQLKQYVQETISKSCYLNIEEKELVAPENWKYLVKDLGGEQKFLEFIRQYFQAEDSEQINQFFNSKECYISFTESSV